VFWNCLLELFTHCRQCSGKVTSKQHFIQGALLSVSTLCENGHRLQWYSQPKVNKRPEGNILIGGALTLSGILFNQFKAFCTAIKLSMFTRPVFDKIINKYVYPVVCHQWQEHKNANINSIMSSELPIGWQETVNSTPLDFVQNTVHTLQWISTLAKLWILNWFKRAK